MLEQGCSGVIQKSCTMGDLSHKIRVVLDVEDDSHPYTAELRTVHVEIRVSQDKAFSIRSIASLSLSSETVREILIYPSPY